MSQPAVPRRNVRPPIPVPGTAGCAPAGVQSGARYAVVRPSARRRPYVEAVLARWDAGLDPAGRYVRRYWTAAIGAPAVADLLRLIQAAKRGRPIRRPVHSAHLARVGLVIPVGSRLVVRSTVPPLPPDFIRALPPWLRRELAAPRPPGGHP